MQFSLSRAAQVRAMFALLLAAVAPAVLAAECSIEIEGRPGKRFEPQQIQVSRQCERFTVVLKHVGKNSKEEAGHNWVLTPASELDAVIADGLAAGVASDYLQPGDARILAHTAMLGGGERDSVSFSPRLLEAGRPYVYFCSFPPHALMMRGTLTLVD